MSRWLYAPVLSAALLVAWPAGAGTLVAIGGGPEDPAVVEQVLALAKGPASRVVVVAAASSDPLKSGAAYVRFFTALGVGNVTVLPLAAREAAYAEAAVGAIAAADLVYATGGSQARLLATLRDTPVHGALVAAYQRGAVIAGNSAGAMVWGERCVVAGVPPAAPTFQPGLGVVPRLLVDTHVQTGTRWGRLLIGGLSAPRAMGLGLEDGVAAVCGPAGLKVLGKGAATLYDFGQATVLGGGWRRVGLATLTPGAESPWRALAPSPAPRRPLPGVVVPPGGKPAFSPAPRVFAVPDVWASGAFERLRRAVEGTPGGVGLGLAPGTGATLESASVRATGKGPVLLLEAQPGGTLAVHRLAPGETMIW